MDTGHHVAEGTLRPGGGPRPDRTPNEVGRLSRPRSDPVFSGTGRGMNENSDRSKTPSVGPDRTTSCSLCTSL